jgi:hypothetical protein
VALRSRSPGRHGELLELDGRTGARRGKVPVGAVPTALGAHGRWIWVANGSLPGPSASLGAGSVQAFEVSSSGRLRVVELDRVRGPLALASTGASAWIVSSGSKTATPVQIRLLGPSGKRTVGRLDISVADETTGAGPDVVVCGGRTSVVGASRSGARTVVASFDHSGHRVALRRVRPGGTATLVCADPPQLAVVVSNVGSGGIVCLRPSATCTARRFGAQTLAAAVAWRGSLVGLNPDQFGSAAGLDRYDPRTGKLLAARAVPRAGPAFLAANGTRLFVLDARTIYRVTR